VALMAMSGSRVRATQAIDPDVLAAREAAWRAFFREWDVLLAPAINVLAYPHIERAWPFDDSDQTLTLTVNGRAEPYLHGLVYPALSTVPGQPATAIPVGISREGLPVGLQVIGPYLEDLTPIRFAALLAREIGGYRKPLLAGHEDLLRELTATRKGITLAELRDALVERGIAPGSLTTIWSSLRRLGLSHKKRR
jgi:Asp-tRNA(Asn)/Glu-tRNA(Gln) amidotransferase A subunit family amidase